MLEEIGRGSELCRRTAVSTCLGADPELDEFMVVASSFIFFLEISRLFDSFWVNDLFSLTFSLFLGNLLRDSGEI